LLYIGGFGSNRNKSYKKEHNKQLNDAKTAMPRLYQHGVPRKIYMDKAVMLLFALMEVYKICQQHLHKQAEYPLWFSRKGQTAAAAEKPSTVT